MRAFTVWRFAWRLVLLGLIGVLHGFIYRGDIIVVLALMGFLLIPFDAVRSNRLLAVIAAFCFAQPYLWLWAAAAASGAFAAEHHISLYTPVIVKYRDEKTDASTTLESALR